MPEHTTYVERVEAYFAPRCSCGWIGQGVIYRTIERAQDKCGVHELYWSIDRHDDAVGVEDYW
jgi:hypothetical protein